jgi:hypothetical protein
MDFMLYLLRFKYCTARYKIKYISKHLNERKIDIYYEYLFLYYIIYNIMVYRINYRVLIIKIIISQILL